MPLLVSVVRNSLLGSSALCWQSSRQRCGTHTVHFLPAQRGSFQGSSLLPPPVVVRGGTTGCTSCWRGSVGGSGAATAATAGRLAIAAPGAAAMRRPCTRTEIDGE